jgi:hypothetical protein
MMHLGDIHSLPRRCMQLITQVEEFTLFEVVV